jgi:hypothetical protein
MPRNLISRRLAAVLDGALYNLSLFVKVNRWQVKEHSLFRDTSANNGTLLCEWREDKTIIVKT